MITDWITNWYYLEENGLSIVYRTIIILAFLGVIVAPILYRKWPNDGLRFWLAMCVIVAPCLVTLALIIVPITLWPLFWALGL